MVKTNWKIKSLLALLVLPFLVACEDESSGSGNVTLPSIGDSPIDSTPVGDIDESGFWVTVASEEFPTFDHLNGDLSTRCIVPSTETGQQVLDCIIDINEGDLYLYDLELQYNAAPSMCENVTIYPSWHWNESAGQGPISVTIDVDATGPTEVVTACSATDQAMNVTTCALNPELTNVTNPTGPTCIYNHLTSGGKNCCFGDYTLTINKTTGSGLQPPDINPTSWGESVTECLGGPVRNGNWDSFAEGSGYPTGLISPVPEGGGLNASITLKANSATTTSAFSTYANFAEFGTGTSNAHNHDGYVSATTSNLPYAFDPVDDYDGSIFANLFGSSASGLYKGSEYFLVRCQDDGFEVKHEIRVRIREWNTFEMFNILEGGTLVGADPDVTGTEGVNCNGNAALGDPCNDRWDFKDLLNALGGSYPTPTPVPPVNETTRRNFYPEIDY